MKRIYLDWNATAPLDPRVLDRMVPYLRQHFGNPSSLHEDGREARRAVEDARESVASAIGAEAREVIFCSSATEANNLALAGVSHGRTGPLLVSAIEHPSVLECAEELGRAGTEVVTLPVTSEGRLDLAAFRAAIARGPSLVAVMAVNNETGVVQPFCEVAEECARRGVPLHVDAVQVLGKLALPGLHAGITSASLSSHKIGGPKGAGALFVRRGCRIHREMHGGGQERGLRAGTENVAAIVGFGVAASLAREESHARRAVLAALEARFLQELQSRNVAFAVHGDRDPAGRIPGTLNLRFPGFSGEGLLFGLDLLGVSVSLGSACSSGAAKMSHVLVAMGVSKQENLESVRFSLGPDLGGDEMTSAAEAVATVLRRGPARGTRG